MVDLVQILLGSVFIFLVILIALNFLAYLVFLFYPKLIISPQEKLRFQYLDRFEGDLKPYLDDWFGLRSGDWEEFSTEYRKHELNVYSYDAFCEYRHPERSGNFINVSGHGFRHGADQGEWPPSDQYFNIFFFGGSTTLNVGPDWTCIPSYVQNFLNRRHVRKPVRVYNFGRGAYFSTLEKCLFFKLLSEGEKPDLAIFLDGINDSFFHHGLPATHGVYTNAITEMNLEISAETRNRTRAVPKWNHFKMFMESLPLSKAVALLRRTAAGVPTESLPRLSEAEIDAAVFRWFQNRHQIEAVGNAMDIPIVFIWQPSPAYKYDLSYHVALPHHFSLHGHERAGDVYEEMSKRIEQRPDDRNFLWLADIQETKHEPLYVDSVHYTDSFCRLIGKKVADFLCKENFVS